MNKKLPNDVVIAKENLLRVTIQHEFCACNHIHFTSIQSIPIKAAHPICGMTLVPSNNQQTEKSHPGNVMTSWLPTSQTEWLLGIALCNKVQCGKKVPETCHHHHQNHHQQVHTSMHPWKIIHCECLHQ